MTFVMIVMSVIHIYGSPAVLTTLQREKLERVVELNSCSDKFTNMHPRSIVTRNWLIVTCTDSDQPGQFH